MQTANFVIPTKFEDLLSDNLETYYVQTILDESDLPAKIKDAKRSYNDNGVAYITDTFDIYYSVIYHKNTIGKSKLISVYNDLQTAVSVLTQNMSCLLEDAENLTPEIKSSYQTIIKMLLFLYCNLLKAIEYKNSAIELQFTVKKKGKKNSSFSQEEGFDYQTALTTINMFLQCDIHLLWEPAVMEEQIVNLIAEVCYPILENKLVSSNKELQEGLFNIFGILLKTYNYDESFLIRLVQLLKIHQHLVKTVAEGIKYLVDNFNSKTLIGEFIREVMEFLMDEKYEDAEGTKHCTATLLEMAKLLPQLMVSEIIYLYNYLNHESSSLRIAVLTVMCEVLVILHRKLELEDSEKMLVEFIPKVLLQHINDVTITVRSKVVQFWARLQKENYASMTMQNSALKQIVAHIHDKGSSVRKNAANTVTSFLEHNPYGSQLSLQKARTEYEIKLQEFKKTEENIKMSLQPEQSDGIQESWNSLEPEILKIILEKPKQKTNNKKKKNTDNEDSDEEYENSNVDEGVEEDEGSDNEQNKTKEKTEENRLLADVSTDQLVPLIKMYIEGKLYRDAYTLCKRLTEEVPDFLRMRDLESDETEQQFILKLMKGFYFQVSLQQHNLVDVDIIKKMDTLEKSVKYYGGAIEFAESLEDASTKIVSLLTSVNITEMQEAVKFFVMAYKFQLDGSELKILELLEIMKLPYEERKSIVIDALVEVFLITSFTDDIKEHTRTVVGRLIRFVRIVNHNYCASFQKMISQWTVKGQLDNNILDMLFCYFTKKEPATADESLAALQLLRMAAHSRTSIITNNLKMTCDVVFREGEVRDMRLIAETCKFLSIAGSRRQSIHDEKPPYRIGYNESIWTRLSDILVENFAIPIPFYVEASTAGIQMIYDLCSRPEIVCQEIIMRIMSLDMWKAAADGGKLKVYCVIRINKILGVVAIYETAHLDDRVYTEVKRRIHIRSKNSKDKRSKSFLEMSSASATKRAKKSNQIESGNDDLNNSTLEGAQAEDSDAQFILFILEHKIVTNPESLGAFVPFILEICENLHKYPNEQVQCGAVLVLLRFMVMSDLMCRQHIALVFKILATTQYGYLKRLIIINMGDLLKRFPNVTEPYSPQVFQRLSDSDHRVQRTAYFILANLLTHNMLRVNKQVYTMALPMVPEETTLGELAKKFFSQLAKNQQMQLYNIIPDMFSFLCTREDIPEKQLQYIMRYVFDLIDKSKYMEGLLERFCAKLTDNEDAYQLKNIGFCLHMIQYNDKCARKLVDNFLDYKDALFNTDLYAFFKQIIASWKKNSKYNLKDIAKELEAKVAELFQIQDQNDKESEAVGTTTPHTSRRTPAVKRSVRGKKKKN